MRFPCLGEILAGLGAVDPRNVNFSNFFHKRHMYQRNHVVWCIIHGRRKLRLTCRLVLKERWEQSHTSLTNGHRVGTPPLNGPPILLPIECTPQRGHPCHIWFWSVDAFLFHRGSNFACFIYLAERPIQQCFALPCSAVIDECFPGTKS